MNISMYPHQGVYNFEIVNLCITGVRVGGGGGGGRGGYRFFGQQDKIWAKPFFNDVSVRFFISLKRQIFSILI